MCLNQSGGSITGVEWEKSCLSFAALTVVEVIDFRYKLLGATFTIICSSIWTYLLAWMCDNYLRRVCSTRLWKDSYQKSILCLFVPRSIGIYCFKRYL